VSVDATIVVAGVLALIAYARSIEHFEARHKRACFALGLALLAFAFVLYDASERLGNVAGPRLRDLELASSP
jgi:hypothetical protein